VTKAQSHPCDLTRSVQSPTCRLAGVEPGVLVAHPAQHGQATPRLHDVIAVCEDEERRTRRVCGPVAAAQDVRTHYQVRVRVMQAVLQR